MASSRKIKGSMNSDTERDNKSPFRGEDSRTEYSKEHKERDVDGNLDGKTRFQSESKDDDYRIGNPSNNQNGEKLDAKVKLFKFKIYLFIFYSNFFLDFSYSQSYFISTPFSLFLFMCLFSPSPFLPFSSTNNHFSPLFFIFSF